MHKGREHFAYLLSILAFLLGIAWSFPPALYGQRVRNLRPNKENAEEDVANFPTPNPKLPKALDRAAELIKQHREHESYMALRPILNGEDYFYRPNATAAEYSSLKTEALRLLKQMPNEPGAVETLQKAAQRLDKLGREVAADLDKRKPGDCLMFRCDVAQSSAAAGGPPLLVLRWRREVSNDPELEAQLKAQLNVYRQRGIAVLSGLHPLVVGETVFMRTRHRAS